MIKSIQYGTSPIEFVIQRSKRTTLAIEVHPDLTVKVIAPADASVDQIEKKVLKRAAWIIKQQTYFEMFLPKEPTREYVSGETHYYLGRRYLLKVKDAKENWVKLKGGQILVYTKYGIQNTNKTKLLLARWYAQHVENKFSNLFKEIFTSFNTYNLPLPELKVARMKNRWGSCTSTGRIFLNPELIKQPVKCIEYVIVHELCHLIHPNHSNSFFELLEHHLPDWKLRKERLEKKF